MAPKTLSAKILRGKKFGKESYFAQLIVAGTNFAKTIFEKSIFAKFRIVFAFC